MGGKPVYSQDSDDEEYEADSGSDVDTLELLDNDPQSQYDDVLGYDPLNLPMREDTDFRRKAWEVSNQLNRKLGKLHGISHLPALAELETILFMRSVPLDLMHLVYINLAPLMVKHWMGDFFPSGFVSGQSPDPYVLHSKTWSTIGQEMADTASKHTPPRCPLPRSLSHPRCPIPLAEFDN